MDEGEVNTTKGLSLSIVGSGLSLSLSHKGQSPAGTVPGFRRMLPPRCVPTLISTPGPTGDA